MNKTVHNAAQFKLYVNVAMGTLQYSTPYYVMIMYVSFMLLIPRDVLPGDSKAIGITCAL